MSHGSLEQETPRDQQCEHCGRWYRNDGITIHEENCDLEDVDAMLVELESREDRGESLTGADPQGSDPQDGEGVASTSEGRDVATNGGPRDPPEPDVQEDVDDVDDDPDQTVDDLPDRYITVDEYLEALHGSDVDVDALEDELEPFDVVDLENTGAREVRAHTIEEVV